MKTLIKTIILFIIGGLSYYRIEILYRGFSDWTMVVVGGLCFLIIGYINISFTWEMSLIKQCLMGSFIVTVIEFCSGMIINKVFSLGVWDYSQMPFNLCGQISLISSLWWIPISLLAIVVDDLLRWKFFKESKPKYKIF
jgi:uncharacterized membrane protein